MITEMVFVYHAAIPNPSMGMPGWVASKMRRDHLLDLGGKVKENLDYWPLPATMEGLPIDTLVQLYPLRA